ncbi:hypothetical protein KXR53_23100 [Inquilinus limosus]|uniref:beta strand repeat-containing protein n=1 Tax=Inquilinus limosus TaxID=171674 RepID=UPI003F14C44B
MAIITGTEGPDDNLIGGAEDDTINGLGGNDGNVTALNGGAGNDIVNGDAGNDVLVGGTGADQLNGGDGVDNVNYGQETQTAGIVINLVTNANGGQAAGDVLTGVEGVIGTNFADLMTGDGANNYFNGGLGDDTLSSGAGNDTLVGGAGADTLDGGDGIDLVAYYFEGPASGVSVNLETGTTGGAAAGDTLTSIEQLAGTDFADTLTGDAGDNNLTGRAGDDVLVGGDGNDVLAGGAGGDSLDGGNGTDWAWYAEETSGVRVNLATNANGGGAAGDSLTSIEVIVGSQFADTLTGDAGDNTLNGQAGSDILSGGDGNDVLVGADAGPDSLDGGNGSDTVWYGDGAAVQINLATGFTGGAAAGDTLTSIESLIGSNFVDTLVGNAVANSLNGGAGDDVLDGAGGADALFGADGDDTAYYVNSAAGVTVDLAAGTGAGGDAEGDTLAAIERVSGSAFVDHLYGSADANVLNGQAGDDTLRGGAGADQLIGGDGSDFANYQGSAAAVTVDLLAGTASGGDAAGDTLAGIENLYGSSNADTLTGDNGRNIIGGELGNDTIVGNGGGDSLSGEAGDDNLDGGDGNDRLVGGAGVDTIHGGIGNDSIDGGSESDVIFGEAGDDTIYGGFDSDQIDGGDGNDYIEGAAGADAITGGAGIDTAVYSRSFGPVNVNLAAGTGTGGDAAGDTLTGIEQVVGSNFNDSLEGDAGNNTLWGGAGDDLLAGGVGADLLKGGGDSDTFAYRSVAESTVAASGKDTIADFSTGDRIDLTGIDADGNSDNGDTAFSFGTGGFTGVAGELRVVDFGDGRQGVYLDVNGDRSPDSIITVYADHALTAADFVL